MRRRILALATTAIIVTLAIWQLSPKDEKEQDPPPPPSPLRLSDSLLPVKRIIIYKTSQPFALLDQLVKRLEEIFVETSIELLIVDLETLSPESIFELGGDGETLNLILTICGPDGETVESVSKLQDWLRAFQAQKDKLDEDDEVMSAPADFTQTRQLVEAFHYQVVGVALTGTVTQPVIFCGAALELDRLLAFLWAKRFSQVYTIEPSGASVTAYTQSLIDTLGISHTPLHTSPRSSRVAIIHASWSNTSRTFAHELHAMLTPLFGDISLCCLGSLCVTQLEFDTAIFVVSSYTFGDPPPAARPFFESLARCKERGEKPLVNLSFAIMGLGDSTYFADCFCKAAFDLETLLISCGAKAIVPLATCDQMVGQQPTQFRQWARTVIGPVLLKRLGGPCVFHTPFTRRVIRVAPLSEAALQNQSPPQTARREVTQEVLEGGLSQQQPTPEMHTTQALEKSIEGHTQAVSEVTQASTQDVTQGLTQDVTQDVTQGLTPDVTQGLTQDVTQSSTQDVTQSSTQALDVVKDDVTQAVESQPEVTETAESQIVVETQPTHPPQPAPDTPETKPSETTTTEAKGPADTTPESPEGQDPHIWVVFGTQTGTSEAYAERLAFQIKDSYNVCVRFMDVECLTLEGLRYEKQSSPPLLCVYVVSTYGDGEPPESCQEFWKAVSSVPEYQSEIQSIPYCVIGLGSSAYPAYCGFAMKLGKKLRTLGATRKAATLRLDDGSRARDDAFDDWYKGKLVPALDTLLTQRTSKPLTLTHTPHVSLKLVPCQRNHDTTPSQHSCQKHLHPTKPSSALSKDIFRSSIQFEITDCRIVGGGDPAHRNYEVTVRSTRALNELDFYAGSTFAFYPEQSPADSQWLIDNVFEWQGRPASEVDKEVIVFEGGEAHVIPTPLPQGVSLREAIESLTNFAVTPSLSWLEKSLRPALPSTHPFVDTESDLSALVCGCVNTVPLTTIEVLRLLYAAEPFKLSVDFLLGMRRQVPRQYTIASTVDLDNGIFRLIVSESFRDRVIPNQLKPHVSPRLMGLVSQILRSLHESQSSRIVRGLSKAAVFPRTVWRHGGVWVAAGSGIAPFLGFLEERRRHQHIHTQSTVLFYGCRSAHPNDFIGRETIVEAVKDGLLRAAYFAFSRQDENAKITNQDIEFVSSPKSKAYVQDRIIEEGNEVMTCVDEEGESLVMVCGNADMGKAAVSSIKQLVSNISDERILVEVW
eukprot:Blabericola_migrator_1__2552@NODE_171_length_12111_cov_153_412405_g148_i0_p1_GENE_NODE_171_length_12111_cov_153_412405_g148_i0NODE_171_length_12111_cov_153_412405_g148_i0_p1_ORF_typecomplete_len1214_score304_47Flavodoxin_1/PF00258_25/0_0034Flavodoxin_1/PF00258_25/4_3e19Flavodoxin_1/PF00258_25/3_2e24NAD_binding_1/PF00175_21/3_8e03NAD_binding_1/PF00175_21/9_3e15Mucin/PF01456_17/0_00026FAD_binding_1/PF00667_20/0_00028NAD_binding_6/PF08030_12/0_036_NODE_171_length_12111_cov_153_412405_g148_i03264690